MDVYKQLWKVERYDRSAGAYILLEDEEKSYGNALAVAMQWSTVFPETVYMSTFYGGKRVYQRVGR